MVSTAYGQSTGFCVDPIEKKPLNHFFPGSSTLSFGTAGCNLGCKFCQNWTFTKSRKVQVASQSATPQMVAQAAQRLECQSVSFTYNDPVIWAEYAIDTANACHDLGIKTVAVTSGYIQPDARRAFFEVMDAANVDLKAFSEVFYQKLTLAHLQPVLDTLVWLRHKSSVWFEITNLVIPGENDSAAEIRELCAWIHTHLGDDVPVHFTAFHPAFRMQHRPPTPPATLAAAYEIAKRIGLKYVYVGNVWDAKRQSTYCPECHSLLVRRSQCDVGQYHLDGHRCKYCWSTIAGRFGVRSGGWGGKRMSVDPSVVVRGAAPK